MRKSLVTLMFLCLALPAFASAQQDTTVTQSYGFLDFQDVVPTEIVSVDPSRGRLVQSLIAVDSFFVGDFTPGQSDTFDPEMMATFDSIVASVGENQFLFFRGTADPMGWSGHYREIENPRLNRDLADARSAWARERAGDGRLLRSVINYPGRGVVIYKATYQDVDEVIAEVVAATPARVDTVVIIHETVIEPHYWINPDTAQDAFRVSIGVGYEGLFTDGFDFNVPTLQFALELKHRLYFAFAAGYRPKLASDDPNEVQGDRSESLIALDVELYPWDMWLGFGAGYLSAYENDRDTDEFLERAYGLTVGPRVRLLDYLVVLGLDFGYFDLSKYGTENLSRRFGIAPSIRLNYVF